MSVPGASSLLSPPAGAQGGGVGGESLEAAGRLVEKHLLEDNSFMELSGQLRIATHRE